MVGWHHGLNAREFEMVKDREARGAAVHGRKESDTTEGLKKQRTGLCRRELWAHLFIKRLCESQGSI